MNIYLYRDNQHVGPYPVEKIREMLGQGQVVAGEAALEEGSQEWRTVGDFTGASEPLIHISQDEQQLGPYTIEQINAELAQGRLQPTAFALHDGMAQWVAVSEIPGVVIQAASSLPVPITAKPGPAVKESVEKPEEFAKPKRGASRALYIVGGVAGVVILAGLIWFFGGGQKIVDFNKLVRKDDLVYVKGENNPFSGLAFLSHENGVKRLEINFKDGKEHGEYSVWYENGKLMHQASYEDGQYSGSVTWWDENGLKASEAFFAAGKEGSFKSFKQLNITPDQIPRISDAE